MEKENLKQTIIRLVGKSESGMDKQSLISATTKGIVFEKALSTLIKNKALSVTIKDGQKHFTLNPQNLQLAALPENKSNEQGSANKQVEKKKVISGKSGKQIKTEVIREVQKKKDIKSKGRDLTKYKFMNQQFSKSRLVLAIFKEYVSKNKNVTLEKLKQVFPDSLMPKFTCIVTVRQGRALDSGGRHRFYHDKKEDLIRLKDGSICCVCSQWSSMTIPGFIKQARSLGFDIR